MIRCSLALALFVSLGVVGCGGDDTASGSDDDDSSSSTTSSNSGGAGQGGSGASSTGSATGGSGGTGGVATGGSGGMPEGIDVEMTVTPETMAAGDTISATITVNDFVLEAPLGQPNEDGHGHFHIYLDGATGTNYLIADQVTQVDLKIPAGTSAGPHTLRISLGQNSHAPVSPAVEDIVDITVTQ